MDTGAHRQSQADPTPRPPWLLRRADQAGVAVLVAAGLASTIGWWIAQGGLRGRVIEVDRAEPKTARFEVDVNTADWPELAALPSIGETLARRIVESRQKDGPFADHDELRRVRGIGPKTMENVRPYLRPMPSTRSMAGK
jgi:competence protein ComEA